MRDATLFRLSIEGADAPWRVLLLAGREHIHEPFSFELTCEAPGSGLPAAALDALLGQVARLSWPTGDGGERVAAGIVDSAEAIDGGHRVVIVPRIAELADVIDHKVFLGKDAATIAEEVLASRHLHAERRLTRVLSPRAQCVQHFESALGFLSRILAEEGIAWWSEPGDQEAIIFADHPAAHEDIAGTATLRVALAAGLTGEETVGRVRLRAAVVSDKIAMRDYDFKRPLADQSVEAAEGDGRLEVYAYPGGYTEPSQGGALARIRLEEARRERLTLQGETSCRRLVPGRVLTLTGGARDDINQRWLIVEVSHALGDAGYLARFLAVPAADGYRPPRSKAPRLGGVQTATTTGPAGTEIHTEEHGRVRAKLRWDRRPERDELASHWLRVAQPPTSGGFFLPRTGWEVLVGFSGPSADAPFVLGRLANGEAPPPEGLPARKVVSAFGTLTTPRAGSGNALRLDDDAGAEGMGFAASGDYKERTENDKVTGVVGTDAYAIGASRKLMVGAAHQVSVSGAQSYTVGGSREVNVNANKSIGAASEVVAIGGARVFTIGGDQTTACGGALVRTVGAAKAEAAIEHQDRSVTGCSVVTVGGAWKVAAGAHATVSVLGASIENVGGAKNVVCGKYELGVTGALSETIATRSVSVSGDRGEQFGATASYTVGGSANVSGADVVFKAKGRITLKAAGATITITPASITIDARFNGAVDSEDHGDEAYR
jgi:type VI secretion system secreted protein VgrG